MNHTSRYFSFPDIASHFLFLVIPQSSFIILSSLFILSCAHQTSPQGGPPDTQPPRIISSYPAPYTLRYEDNRIALEFDEYVEERTVEESVFISPHIGELEFDWSGTEVEVSFSERLRKNTTYVVTVGTDVVDLRNRNRMAQAFTLAFSTGDEIDRGAIQGRIFAGEGGAALPEGVMIFAYLLDHLNSDTLNPQTLKPDYISQTGSGGDFFLRHLSLGSYRIFAVKDEYRNLLYDPEADEYGVPFRDIRLTSEDTLASGILMRLAKEDTTKPRLIKAVSKDRNHVLAEFSEPLDTSTVSVASFIIIDTLSQETLSFTHIFPEPEKHSSLIFLTTHQDSTKRYLLTVVSVEDLAGNSINPLANSLSFDGSGAPDTVGLRMWGWSAEDTSRGVSLNPEIFLYLTDVAQKPVGDDFLQLMDSSGNAVPIRVDWMNGTALRVTPEKKLQGLMPYRLRFDLPKLKSWNGDTSVDTVKTIRFITLDADALSTIEGIVVDRNVEATGNIVLEAESIGEKVATTYHITLSRSGVFTFPEIRQGRYVLSAYRDVNVNHIYDPGRPFPYVMSERFIVYPDTLKLRARWPIEGVRIELR
ncbi:MAG: Ig-like domain-containing protein [Ignavibacteriales bacterium]|nr:Ig-like domain-containing protein [Ignavibacteriales bacterium]